MKFDRNSQGVKDACRQIEAELSHPKMAAVLDLPVPATHDEAMAQLGALLASVMPDPDDDDDCEHGLSVREVGAIIDADSFAEQFCSNRADECGCDWHRDGDVFSMQARREMGLDL